MGADTYIARVLDPDYRYSGEPEAWRDNLALIATLATSRGLLDRASVLARAAGRRAEQVDWATWFAEVTIPEVRGLLGPRREEDVQAWRPFMPGASDEEIRVAVGLDPHASLDRLDPAEAYAIVEVERI